MDVPEHTRELYERLRKSGDDKHGPKFGAVVAYNAGLQDGIVAALSDHPRGVVDPCGGLRLDIDHILRMNVGDAEDGAPLPNAWYERVTDEIMERIAAPTRGAVYRHHADDCDPASRQHDYCDCGATQANEQPPAGEFVSLELDEEERNEA